MQPPRHFPLLRIADALSLQQVQPRQLHWRLPCRLLPLLPQSGQWHHHSPHCLLAMPAAVVAAVATGAVATVAAVVLGPVAGW